MARSRVGIWLIGAKGGVATTTMVGLAALKRGWISETGLVSALPQFAGADLAYWKDFVVGGHDVRAGSLFDEAAKMSLESRAIDHSLLQRLKPDLERTEKELRVGTLIHVGKTIEQLADDPACVRRETPRAAIARLQADIAGFAARHKLGHVVVVNVASTEPAIAAPESLPSEWAALDKLIEKPAKCPLPASSLYAIAALDAGHSFINFTPSLGATPRAIGELATLRSACHAGYDGKTGETLLKSVLAPMFAQRNLEVMSWVGHNIFGNMDGKVLEDPENKKAKVTSKDRLLREIFGYSPQTLVSIEYIASLGDWKTAWDHIHFRGFLGTPMTFQFIWQGCDSLLAAPLVLDLVRFTERAHRAGQSGVLRFLGSFFKSPLGVDRPAFADQFRMLDAWAAELAPRHA